MRILITGSRGMLGRTLLRLLPLENTELVVSGSDIGDFDITSADETFAFIRSLKPDIVVHCAAMTDVDGCESQFENAMKVNALGTSNVASAVNSIGGRIISISTDYVFSGNEDVPYNEWDVPQPLTVYGKSKVAAEEAVRVHCSNHVILRIAWLYGCGGPSFFHTMCCLGKTDGPPLKVVSDQIGNPTSADSLVPVIGHFIRHDICGTFHSTCEGEATWYDFAKQIFQVRGFTRNVESCTSKEYPRPAPRPFNSRLDNMAFRLSLIPEMPHWKDALFSFIERYPDE